MAASNSIFSRKRDLVYMIHFSIGIPIAFVMDLQAIYPPHLVPDVLTSVKDFYINTYQDQFYVQTPPFFKLFLWIELLYQVPVMIWGLGGLYRNSPKAPLVLLPFAIKVFLTTLTCMVEYSYWPLTFDQKISLTTLYGPYLALSTFMMFDMYFRLNVLINRQIATTSTAKKIQ